MVGLFERAYERLRPERWHLAPGQEAPVFRVSVTGLPRYLVDRAAVRRRFRRQTEDTPWITADGVAILAGLLRPGDVGVEFGSGGSTTWFASRVEYLYSVEGADPWHADVTSRLSKAGLANVSYHLASQLELGIDHPDARQAYVNFAPELAPGSQDFVFVDGEYRDECAMRGLELLKPGGILILDNANTYLPNALRSPWKVARPSTTRWAEFVEATADWRSIWTTNGVWDTAFWFKPWLPSVSRRS